MQALQTERLLLRRWQPEEWRALYDLHADLQVAQWLGGALSVHQAQAALAAIATAAHPHLYLSRQSALADANAPDRLRCRPGAGLHPGLPESHPLRAHVYYEWRAA